MLTANSSNVYLIFRINKFWVFYSFYRDFYLWSGGTWYNSEMYHHVLIVYKHAVTWFMYLLFFVNYNLPVYKLCILLSYLSFLLSKAFLAFPYHTHSASCPSYPASLHIPQHRALPHLSPPSSSTSASQSFSFILPLPQPPAISKFCLHFLFFLSYWPLQDKACQS